MSTVDLSRNATDFRKHFDGVRMQQGRVLTDDDFNEAAQLTAEELRQTRLHAIGAYGSPDHGFNVKLPTVNGGKTSFTFSAGNLYLGGLRLMLEADEVFELQKDWLTFNSASDMLDAPVDGAERIDLVWIEAWQQPVTAVEDKELFEVALGGPDTSIRWRTMRRVQVLSDIQQEDCADAWAAGVAQWTAEGRLEADFEFATDARLTVSFSEQANKDDLCSPATAGGYLGAENQAIRVQMVDSTHYTWGFDNAAPLYRALLSVDNGIRVKLTLLTEPRDAMHWPLKDQVIELLPWGAALANGQRSAELSGHLTKVATSYDPDTAQLTIVDEPPVGFENQWEGRVDQADFFDGSAGERYVFVRIWNRGDDLASPTAIPIAQGDLGHTGLTVGFVGGPLRANDYWIIAARPAAPDVLTPWLLEAVNGAAPQGLKRYRAPLALIRWSNAGGAVTGEVIHDCRPPFLPLTHLRGCCTVSVGDGSHSFGHFSSINAAIAALPVSGVSGVSGGVVCILPGIFEESVSLQDLNNIVLRGCGPRTRLIAQVDVNGVALPGISIENCRDISIESLAVEAGPLPTVWVNDSERVSIRGSLLQMRNVASLFTSVYLNGTDLSVEGCDILTDASLKPETMVRVDAVDAAGVKTRGGIQIGGGCEGVRIADNRISGGLGHGIVLGSLIRIEEGGDEGTFVVDIDEDDDCATCGPIDIIWVPGEDSKVSYRSAGDLYDIEICGNLIAYQGGNGISVVRLFGISSGSLDLIAVHGLRIEHNRIERCVQREVAKMTRASQFFAAYGGVILALVSELIVEHNAIVACGADAQVSACGVYALFVQGLAIEHNRIIGNGPSTVEAAQSFLSAGIHIWVALPGRNSGLAFAQKTHGRSPACLGNQMRVLDNVVDQPQGRALFVLGMGALSIADNRMASYTVGHHPLDSLATTVLAGNFGISREWTTGLLAVLLLSWNSKNKKAICLYARLSKLAPQASRYWSGKLLFTDNQLSFDSVASGQNSSGFSLSSTLLFSLDDVAVLDNQIEFHAEWRGVLANLIAVGVSVRVNDNRFAETFGRCFRSAGTLGFMNTTSHNQSTHCLWTGGRLTVVDRNLALIEAFCENECNGKQQI